MLPLSLTIILCVFLSVWAVILMSQDMTGKAYLTTPCRMLLYVLITPHLPVIGYALIRQWNAATAQGNVLGYRILIILTLTLLFCFHFYTVMRLHIVPFCQNESGSKRIGAMYGGLILLRLSIAGMVLQLICFLVLYRIRIAPEGFAHLTQAVQFWLIFDCIYTVVFLFLFLLNGCIRILCFCRRLGIVKRILICCNLWIPIVNLVLLHMLSRAAKDEYAIALMRYQSASARQLSQDCKTVYPLIMVHGIGFRDLKYFNYWGRIPLYLKKSGATVYYGHQKAWGSIEENAAAIARTIDLALSETGATKVNIIAHSKGGLDSRYLISHLGYADKVASLTTMSTPHRGSELINFLNKLPDSVYRFIAHQIDRSFSTLGDDAPDCYHSSKQLAPAYCEEFNRQTPDMPGILYQSYASVMRGMFSDSLLSVPYLLMHLLSHQPNDGLVTKQSAMWGNFLGTFESSSHRGVSHGDMIDLKREDLKGFDIIEAYQTIVAHLKEQGY